MLNPNMEFYRLAGLERYRRTDSAHDDRQGYDERGVIGLAEPPVMSPGAAISNAVANAIGVRVPFMPLTPRTCWTHWKLQEVRMRSGKVEAPGFSRAVAGTSVSYQGTTSVVPNSRLFSLKGHGFSRAVPAHHFSLFRAGFSPKGGAHASI